MRLLTTIERLRPSNLIILFALPFIGWLFVSSSDYSRSLKAIVGVEPGSLALLPGFALVAGMFGAGLAAGLVRRHAQVALAASLACGLALALTPLGLPFCASVLANAVDPFTSPLIVQGETPRRLTDTTLAVLQGRMLLWLAVPLLSAGLWALRRHRFARRGFVALHGLGLAGLILFAHLGFAVGLVISIRAAVTAYLLAVVLGLIWVGMMHLRASRRSTWGFVALTLALLAGAGGQFAQPRLAHSLIGTPAATLGIVKDTPQGLIDTVRYGTFPGAPGGELPVRSFSTREEALAALAAGTLSGALVLDGATLPAGATVFWQAAALPNATATLAISLLVLAIACGLITAAGALHQRHPLSIAAEFIIDTLRGIPMLVIILYIGLPLAGVLKSASGGFIDPPNMLRGITAMAIAYSAYLAEIFRSGINAVPQGQIEAARSLGLSRWSTARLVILPQAFRIVIPPMGNEFIAILKDTSLLSILSIRDLTQRMREFQSASFLPFAPYNTAAIVYVLLTLVAASLVARVEHRFRGRGR